MWYIASYLGYEPYVEDVFSGLGSCFLDIHRPEEIAEALGVKAASVEQQSQITEWLALYRDPQLPPLLEPLTDEVLDDRTAKFLNQYTQSINFSRFSFRPLIRCSIAIFRFFRERAGPISPLADLQKIRQWFASCLLTQRAGAWIRNDDGSLTGFSYTVSGSHQFECISLDASYLYGTITVKRTISEGVQTNRIFEEKRDVLLGSGWGDVSYIDTSIQFPKGGIEGPSHGRTFTLTEALDVLYGYLKGLVIITKILD